MALEPIALGANGLAPPDNILQTYAKNHTNVFNSLRKSIKKEGDMFLFGEPTDLQMKVLLKLYHENVLKNLSNIAENYSCMFGILQDTEDNLYVTISESPGYAAIGNTRTDPDYMKKREMVINLLTSAKIGIEYPETDGIINPSSSELIQWRKGERGGISEKVENAGGVRSSIKAPITFVTEGGETIGSIKDVYLYNEDERDKVNIYMPSIRNLDLTVKYVDSVQYLRERAAGHPTFRPFKKRKEINPRTKNWKSECNNGHLCTESKLFAYAFYNEITPKSFVAYWIGKGTPPERHILPKYCYRTVYDGEGTRADVLKEIEKLNTLTTRCSAVLTGIDEITSTPNFRDAFQRVVQPIAVACPGCFANIEAYMRGEMANWNARNCYVPRRGVATGGTRHKHKHKHRHRHSTQKHKKTRKH